MKQYCLKDIWWIYTNDGKFVTPFIFNHNNTKIRDLTNDEVIELDISKSSPISAVQKHFTNVLHTEDYLYTIQFRELFINERLQLKGIKNLKFAKLKHDLLKNGHSTHFLTFIVNEEDIHTLTKEIAQHFNPKTKKQKDCENLHNITSQF